MDSEIQKAVDAGKLTSHAAQILEALKPGSYCFHKSWGFGRVESLNVSVAAALLLYEARRQRNG